SFVRSAPSPVSSATASRAWAAPTGPSFTTCAGQAPDGPRNMARLERVRGAAAAAFGLCRRTTTIFRSRDEPHLQADITNRRELRTSTMSKGEPPPACCPSSAVFRIGRNSRGNWVVQDQSGLCGGLFISRPEALKFAMFENGNRPRTVIMVPGPLELDMSGSPRDADRVASNTDVAHARAA